MFSRLSAAEDQRDASQRDTMRHIFDQFDLQYVECCVVLCCISSDRTNGCNGSGSGACGGYGGGSSVLCYC